MTNDSCLNLLQTEQKCYYITVPGTSLTGSSTSIHTLGTSLILKGENEKPETGASFPLFIDILFLALEVFLNHILGLGLLAIILQMDTVLDYFHKQNKSMTEQ